MAAGVAVEGEHAVELEAKRAHVALVTRADQQCHVMPVTGHAHARQLAVLASGKTSVDAT